MVMNANKIRVSELDQQKNINDTEKELIQDRLSKEKDSAIIKYLQLQLEQAMKRDDYLITAINSLDGGINKIF